MIKDGIHDNISIEDYHANTSHVSATQIKIAKRSLKEFFWYRNGLMPKEEKSHFSFGNAFELALMDPIGFSEKVAIKEDAKWCAEAKEQNPYLTQPRSSKYYQTKAAEFVEANKGKYIINDFGKESYETIKKMLESCYADKAIQGLIRNTETQLSLFWTDKETGLKMKTRPDICKRKKNVVVNVKTTEDGSPRGFTKDLVNYDYPLQAAIEITGCLATGLMESVDLYYWLVVEKVAPFNATIYEFSKEDQESSMIELEYLQNKLVKAAEENLYPGYSDRADNEFGIVRAEIPTYYKMANL